MTEINFASGSSFSSPAARAFLSLPLLYSITFIATSQRAGGEPGRPGPSGGRPCPGRGQPRGHRDPRCGCRPCLCRPPLLWRHCRSRRAPPVFLGRAPKRDTRNLFACVWMCWSKRRNLMNDFFSQVRAVWFYSPYKKVGNKLNKPSHTQSSHIFFYSWHFISTHSILISYKSGLIMMV